MHVLIEDFCPKFLGTIVLAVTNLSNLLQTVRVIQMRWVDLEIANLGFLTQDSMWGSTIYPYLPHGWFSQFEPSHPSGVSYFPLKLLAFEIPHPLRISNDHP